MISGVPICIIKYFTALFLSLLNYKCQFIKLFNNGTDLKPRPNSRESCREEGKGFLRFYPYWLRDVLNVYHKILIISPGAYICSKVCFAGRIFGRAYFWRGLLSEYGIFLQVFSSIAFKVRKFKNALLSRAF